VPQAQRDQVQLGRQLQLARGAELLRLADQVAKRYPGNLRAQLGRLGEGNTGGHDGCGGQLDQYRDQAAAERLRA
jgi:hypothetical protein